MAYEKHTWQTGEVITAEKLNNLEDGIAQGGSDGFFTFKITVTKDGESSTPIFTKNASFAEIKAAMLAGKVVIATIISEDSGVMTTYETYFPDYEPPLTGGKEYIGILLPGNGDKQLYLASDDMIYLEPPADTDTN